MYSKAAAKASKNQPEIAYQNSPTSSPPSQSTATAAAASSGDAIGIYLHSSGEWQDDSSTNFTGVYEMIDDVPISSSRPTLLPEAAAAASSGDAIDIYLHTSDEWQIDDVPTTSSSRPTPLPAAAAAACYNVGTGSVGLQAGQKLNHNQGEPRAINNLQPDDSEKRASNNYLTIIDDYDVPTTSSSRPTPLPRSAPPPQAAAAADGFSFTPDSDYSQPRNTSGYMPMSQHSSSSPPTLLPPSTPETAAVYEEAGVSVDDDNPYVQPSKSFDNELYFCEVKPSTEMSDVPDGQTH